MALQLGLSSSDARLEDGASLLNNVSKQTPFFQQKILLCLISNLLQ